MLVIKLGDGLTEGTGGAIDTKLKATKNNLRLVALAEATINRELEQVSLHFRNV